MQIFRAGWVRSRDRAHHCLRVLSLVLATLVPGARVAAQEAADTTTLARFEKILERLRGQLKVPGISAAIVRDQEVIWARGFGHADLERGIEATPDTPYHLASVTKPLAAIIVHRLVERGVLDLADPIPKYRALGAEIPYPERGTLEHLITHTAGGEAPGTTFEYHGDRYGGLGVAIKRASGRSFLDLFVEEVAEPLAMRRTAPSFVDPDLLVRFQEFQEDLGRDPAIRDAYGSPYYIHDLHDYRHARYFPTYLVAENLVVNALESTDFGWKVADRREVRSIDEDTQADFDEFYLDDNPFVEVWEDLAKPYALDTLGKVVRGRYPTFFNPAAGMLSTVEDLARFDVALDRDLLISAATRELAFTPYRLANGELSPYGLGFFSQEYDGVRLIWHGGEWTCISALYLKVPQENLTLIALANARAMSQAFFMGQGNVMQSGVALPFLRLFVFEERFGETGPDVDWAAEPAAILSQLEPVRDARLRELHRQELGIAEVMFGRMGAPAVRERLSQQVRGPLQSLWSQDSPADSVAAGEVEGADRGPLEQDLGAAPAEPAQDTERGGGEGIVDAEGRFWPRAEWGWFESVEQAGWSAEGLGLARDYSRSVNSAAVMIVQGGRIVDAWGDLAEELVVQSVRKSFLSALYGVYLDEAEIDIESPLYELGIDDDVAPSLTPDEREATIQHLLQARSGVYHGSAASSPDMDARLPPRGSHAPGTFHVYNNWDFNALGTIFIDLTGADVFEAFHERVAVPLGMQDFTAEDGIYQFEPVSEHPAYHFVMTARDMARFGLLFARGGRWLDHQIVPADWVEESTTSYSETNEGGGYGYMWWIGPQEGSYAARGGMGHEIRVFPAEDLVLVHRVPMEPGVRSPNWQELARLWDLVLAARPE